MKKLFSLLLVCALAFTMSVSAFAAEAAPSTEKEPPAQTEVDATTRAADIPTESVALWLIYVKVAVHTPGTTLIPPLAS